MRRARLRRWARWSCTIAAVTVLALAVISGFSGASLTLVSGNRMNVRYVSLGTGLLRMRLYTSFEHNGSDPGLSCGFSGFGGWDWATGGGTGWHAGLTHREILNGHEYGASVIYPVVLTCAPAAMLWHAERRRRRPGQCAKCGYDRRGLAADAKCPECGAIPAPVS